MACFCHVHHTFCPTSSTWKLSSLSHCLCRFVCVFGYKHLEHNHKRNLLSTALHIGLCPLLIWFIIMCRITNSTSKPHCNSPLERCCENENATLLTFLLRTSASVSGPPQRPLLQPDQGAGSHELITVLLLSVNRGSY